VIKIAQLRAGAPIGEERASTDLPPEYVIDDGDVIFSWSGSLIVDVWCGGRGALNQHLFKVTSQEYPKWFYLHWVKEHLPEFQGIAADKATTMGHIRRHHLTDAQVVVPGPELLHALSRLQDPLLARIVANKVENRTLEALRNTLLPALLSGEITIKHAEKAVAEVA
jgi:type I restriction enzyme, S subunit